MVSFSFLDLSAANAEARFLFRMAVCALPDMVAIRMERCATWTLMSAIKDFNEDTVLSCSDSQIDDVSPAVLNLTVYDKISLRVNLAEQRGAYLRVKDYC